MVRSKEGGGGKWSEVRKGGGVVRSKGRGMVRSKGGGGNGDKYGRGREW